ncbi:lymphocyte expansion molecule-like, partial [Argonauta hians]
TGPRTLKFVSKANKYRTSPFAAQYEIKSNIDILFDESTSFRGKFAKADRWNKNNFSTRICLMNPLNPETPGPGQYHIGGEKKSRGQPAPPFASSAPRGGGFNAPTACTVSPDRYDILLWQEKQPVNGHCSVFRSKTKRPTHNQIRILNARLQNCPQPPDTHIQDNVSTSIRKALNNI